uniref:SAC domain-containing protein n=1 Tax=Glossina pallidipes TaxID=7398 RepID=A0A1A9ZCS4_GLOPL
MNNSNSNIVFNPLISGIQKVVLYETKTLMYLVGSNNRETRFRVLIIDRTLEPEDGSRLHIIEDPNEYNALGIRRFLSTLGSPKVTSAYGVLGFVRFLEGYYLLLVTKRKCCAHLGMHLIYTIKDTVMVKVNEPTAPHSYEERYKRMFQNIDLRSNFYFSYSYDLTRTLQYNSSAPRYVGPGVNIEIEEPIPDWDKLTNNVQQANGRVDYAFRSCSRKRFVWNAFLLEPMKDIVHKDWLLEVTHGYVSQSCVSVFGRRINVCLIARRSTRFAGTRFLKRGANFRGDVANEVETEQIVSNDHDMCSFTQMRGSVPSHWSQDISKMVPKPPIQLDITDPFAQTSARHFERLLFHYGSPLIMLNLVKKREKRQHESILSKELVNSIRYLNQFLPPPHRMKYIHFDMARKSRGGDNVMEMLAEIAESVLQQTGMFLKARGLPLTFQTGIVRTNCVDCLDRTNTAQFAIGKCALGHQLERLGFLKSAKLEFDSECVTMLENLYEEHGDTLALQYGGSQLVHRIKTYRKTAAWASQGNDIMQTLSRYYSNTFNDTEKQHSINLFLGYYMPSKGHNAENQPIWEQQTDYYMHNVYQPSSLTEETRPITDWVRSKIRKCLPHSCSDLNKIVNNLIEVVSKDFEMIDGYSNYYQSFKWTDFGEHISYELASRSIPTCRSPFQRQIQEGKARKNPSLTGQSSTSSTNSNESSSSEGDDSSTDEDLSASLMLKEQQQKKSQHVTIKPRTLEQLLPPMNEVYGCKVSNPSKDSMSIYKRYAQMGKLSTLTTTAAAALMGASANSNAQLSRLRPTVNAGAIINLKPLSDYGTDSYLSVKPPVVSEKSLRIYADYCVIPRNFNAVPKFDEFNELHRYILML